MRPTIVPVSPSPDPNYCSGDTVPGAKGGCVSRLEYMQERQEDPKCNPWTPLCTQVAIELSPEEQKKINDLLPECGLNVVLKYMGRCR